MDENMKLGDYILHVFIQESSSLFDDGAGTVDPKIKIEAMDEIKFTSSRTGVPFDSKTYWGEHLFFTKTYDNRLDMEDDYLLIAVHDQSRLFGSTLIGSVRINLIGVYFEKEHAMKNKWVILENRSVDIEKIMGYLKVSISFSQVGEARVILFYL